MVERPFGTIVLSRGLLRRHNEGTARSFRCRLIGDSHSGRERPQLAASCLIPQTVDGSPKLIHLGSKWQSELTHPVRAPSSIRRNAQSATIRPKKGYCGSEYPGVDGCPGATSESTSASSSSLHFVPSAPT